MAKGGKRTKRVAEKQSLPSTAAAVPGPPKAASYPNTLKKFKVVFNQPHSFALARAVNVRQLDDGTVRMAVLYKGFGSDAPIPIWIEVKGNPIRSAFEIAPLDPRHPASLASTIPWPASKLINLDLICNIAPQDLAKRRLVDHPSMSADEDTVLFWTHAFGGDPKGMIQKHRDEWVRAMALGNVAKAMDAAEYIARFVHGQDVEDPDHEHPVDWWSKDPATERWILPAQDQLKSIPKDWFVLRDERDAHRDPETMLARYEYILNLLRRRKQARRDRERCQNKFPTLSNAPPPTICGSSGPSDHHPSRPRINFHAVEELEMFDSAAAVSANGEANNHLHETDSSETSSKRRVYTHATDEIPEEAPSIDRVRFILILPMKFQLEPGQDSPEEVAKKPEAARRARVKQIKTFFAKYDSTGKRNVTIDDKKRLARELKHLTHCRVSEDAQNVLSMDEVTSDPVKEAYQSAWRKARRLQAQFDQHVEPYQQLFKNITKPPLVNEDQIDESSKDQTATTLRTFQQKVLVATPAPTADGTVQAVNAKGDVYIMRGLQGFRPGKDLYSLTTIDDKVVIREANDLFHLNGKYYTMTSDGTLAPFDISDGKSFIFPDLTYAVIQCPPDNTADADANGAAVHCSEDKCSQEPERKPQDQSPGVFVEHWKAYSFKGITGLREGCSRLAHTHGREAMRRGFVFYNTDAMFDLQITKQSQGGHLQRVDPSTLDSDLWQDYFI